MNAAPMPHPAPDPDADIRALQPGTRLLGDQYTIDAYLSSGGFGITYLARDSLNRQVVIKECFPEVLCSRAGRTVRARSSSCTDEFNALVRMFVREAHSLAKLEHPNIVGVHQIFEDNDTAYMALDFIDGRDLLDFIEGGDAGLPPERIEALTRALLRAIADVHAADMLHRDISPDNILIDKQGQPYLIDFGAARQEATRKSRAISALLVVKDGYSPQEFYISGGQQGPSSDLYSLAATLYHLTTGTPPPDSQNRLAALAANKPDPYQPLTGRLEGFGPGFLAAIDQAMHVFPAERPQTAQDWLDLMDGVRPAPAGGDDVLEVISGLVDEVARSIDEDKAAEAEAAETVALVPTTSLQEVDHDRWWPLTEPIEDEPAAQPAPAPVVVAPEPDAPQALRSRKRRLSALAVLVAAGITFAGGPADNAATAEARHMMFPPSHTVR